MKKWNTSSGLAPAKTDVTPIREAVVAGCASGILIGTSYIPFPPWALLICYVPLMVFWMRTESLRHAFLAGWMAQFILSLIGFHWIAHLAVEFGHLPEAVSWLVMIGFASFMHLHIPLAGLLFVLVRKKARTSPTASVPAKMFWLLPLTLLTVECSYPVLFPWNLGYTLLWAKIPLFHFADVVGFAGLSGSIFFANSAVSWLWLNRAEADRHRIHRWRAVALSFFAGIPFLVLMGQLYGERQAQEFQPADAPHFKALLVQANIGNFEKFWAEKRADFRTPIIDQYVKLTEDAPRADFVLWPETAFPDALDVPLLTRPNQQRLIQLIKKIHATFVVGGYSEDPRRGLSYNSIFQFDPDGQPVAKYHKRKLLAFGEYFPGAEIFPFLKSWFPEIPAFERGKSSTPMNLSFGTQIVPAALQICYEGLFPTFTQDFFKDGPSDIIVNVTNDSWYDAYFEPRQHLTMTLARAVEFRRPLLRATNTGISTVMLASGETLLASPMSVEWSHVYEVPYRAHAPRTVYAQFCTLMPWYLWLVWALTGGTFYVHAVIRRSRSQVRPDFR